MHHEYMGSVEDSWPKLFALVDKVASYLIIKQGKMADPYVKNVVMEDMINAVIDLRIDLAARLTDVAADLAESRRRGEGSPDADAL